MKFTFKLTFLFCFLFGMALYGNNASKDSILTKLKELNRDKENYPEQDTVYIKSLNELSLTYLYENPDSTLYYANLAYDESKAINYKYGMVDALLNQGSGHIYRGEIQMALTNVKSAIAMAETLNFTGLQLKGINSLGMIHFFDSDYANAYLRYIEGIALAKKVQDSSFYYRLNMNLGTSFSLLKDYDKAFVYYNEAETALKIIKDSIETARLWSNLGYTYLNLKKYQKSLEYLNKAEYVFRNNKVAEWLAFTYITKAKVNREIGDYERALELIKLASLEHDKLNDRKGRFDCEIVYAQLLYDLKYIDEAHSRGLSAYNLAKEMNFSSGLIQSSQLLYKVYKAENNFEEALHHLKLSQQMADSVGKRENKTKLLLKEAQINHERGLEEQEYIAQAQIQRQKNITYISLAVLVSFIPIVFLVRKNNLTQKKANELLSKTNQNKDRIFSIIGQDLKSPIRTLQDVLGLYKGKTLEERDIAAITPTLKDNVDYSAYALNNLLVWAQIEMKNLGVFPKKVSFASHLSKVVGTYQDLFSKKGLLFQSNIEETIELTVDIEHLTIILRNLLHNAIKYSHKGDTIFVSGTKENNIVKLSVCDEGTGMEESLKNDILTKTEIEPLPGTDNEHGTGIGLLICKELITLNKGTLNIVSKLGTGSCFHIEFSANGV
ncbi:MAG: tetratricopeptide repeat protein [Croceitalea sp.]|nr:tetratricopeptide repeat protein [Croceitalea sp.]